MYKIFIGCFAVFFFAVAISSCQKEIGFDTPTSAGGSTGTFRAKVDGVQYTADASVSASIILGVTTIIAYSKDKKIFSIAITDSASGTYVLDQNSLHGIAYLDSTDANKNAFTTDDGKDTTQAGGKITLSVDRIKKIISGTFACKLYRNSDSKQKVVTDGSFQLSYTTTIAAAKTTDTFHVQIDGAEWTGKSIQAVASGGYLSITASERNLTRITSFQLPQAITAGVYDLDITGNYFGLYLPDGINPYTTENGKITVVEHKTSTKRIRASFYFKAAAFSGTGSYQFTNGYFSVGY